MGIPVGSTVKLEAATRGRPVEAVRSAVNRLAALHGLRGLPVNLAVYHDPGCPGQHVLAACGCELVIVELERLA